MTDMAGNNERMHILEMIENGIITAEDGMRLLQALENQPDGVQPGTEAGVQSLPESRPPPADPQQLEASELEAGSDQPVTGGEAADSYAAPGSASGTAGTSSDSPPFETSLNYWRRWWMIPMWIGVGITIVGGLLMYLALRTSGIGFWFGCAWLPFLLGLAVMALTWSSRSARWLHLRVQQKPGSRPQTIAISFPLPLRLTAWFLRVFGHRIPGLENTGVDEILMAVGETTSPETPFYLEVDEGEDGEKVQIYIG